MEDRRHDDDQAKVRAIVDNAIAELVLFGLERDEAALLMACQATLRITDNEKVKQVAKFVDDSIWDVDDTND